ncbi:Uncharacterised protein [Vibrio cholerae]|nr:Uncharacterised protein [Vibrio cholerae]
MIIGNHLAAVCQTCVRLECIQSQTEVYSG